MIVTRVTKLLGLRYPIFQGGMAWASDHSLAAAVSDGGGLGIIGSAAMTPDQLRDEINAARKLTDKPFGVNLLLYHPQISEFVELVRNESVSIVTTGAGSPGKHMEALLSSGAKVFPVVASVDMARRLEKYGASGVICEGHEAAGHIGELTTMTLTPQVVDAVKIPVIAAGGIADGRGMAAALMLGAEGVQVGTRFTCAEECPLHHNWKEAVIKARDRATTVTGRSTGHPVRALKNKLTREFGKMEEDGIDPIELHKIGEGALQRAAQEGDVSRGSVMIGQISGLVKKVQPAAEILKEMAQQAEKTLRDAAADLLVEGEKSR